VPPRAQIGRLLVYESGAVRLALGDVLLELHAGTAAELRQDVALIDAGAKQAVWLLADGVHARGVACPDMDHLLGCAARCVWVA
jgi:DNA-directed RNA polymerase III subunit RPC4